MGITNYVINEDSKSDFKELFIQADDAMYLSKQQGRNQVSFYQANKNTSAESKMQTISA